MNMASFGILCLFTVIYISIGNAAFIELECRAEHVGQYGQQSLLECVVKITQEVPDVEIRVVTWRKKGVEDVLLVFNGQDVSQKSGYSFAESSWNVQNMNVSLLITNTSVENEGLYECMVVTDRGDNTKLTSLKVKAKYSKPVVQFNQVTRTLMCDSHGGYLKGQLRWFSELSTEWTKSSEMEAELEKSGLFHLSSKLTLLEGSTFSKYTCIVFNASGDKEEEATFEIQGAPKYEGQRKDLDPASKIVAPVVVIGSLITGLLMALLIYRRRSQRGHHRVETHEAVVEVELQEMDEPCRDNMA
ncbi:uncharacterized protein LOC115014100 [Cottoperca gobio]|uniref:Uncharacterized protein LOC115014100 n=1 Tax=Cottoperca gobio TaxID=56716 RepID=A0A6J2QF35_COTGO|nr:uncharacterized protein LOC115014100 [Cottoperca gobio]XP_029296623.1 uncharacterized protein LOC115014100 [Cottoperca gobio]